MVSVNIQEIIQPGKVVLSGENSKSEKGADSGSSAHGELVVGSSSGIDSTRDTFMESLLFRGIQGEG
jgi:hypothetical protein